MLEDTLTRHIKAKESCVVEFTTTPQIRIYNPIHLRCHFVILSTPNYISEMIQLSKSLPQNMDVNLAAMAHHPLTRPGRGC